MTSATLTAKPGSVLTRLLATVAIVCVYVFGSLAAAGAVMTFGVTKAEAGRAEGGAEDGDGAGRGIYYGGSYCSLQRIRCADIYGWGSRAYYRCTWRRGC